MPSLNELENLIQVELCWATRSELCPEFGLANSDPWHGTARFCRMDWTKSVLDVFLLLQCRVVIQFDAQLLALEAEERQETQQNKALCHFCSPLPSASAWDPDLVALQSHFGRKFINSKACRRMEDPSAGSDVGAISKEVNKETPGISWFSVAWLWLSLRLWLSRPLLWRTWVPSKFQHTHKNVISKAFFQLLLHKSTMSTPAVSIQLWHLEPLSKHTVSGRRLNRPPRFRVFSTASIVCLVKNLQVWQAPSQNFYDRMVADDSMVIWWLDVSFNLLKYDQIAGW